MTNQVKDVEQIFVRVRGDKVKGSEEYKFIRDGMSFSVEAEGMAAATNVASAQAKGKLNYHRKHEEEEERRIFNYLIHGGFNHFPFGETMPFPAENDHLMYVSVHDGDKMWYTDMAVDPKSYGCITIKGDREGISVHPSNPEPCWVELEKDDSSFSTTDLVEVERRGNNIPVYLGTAIWQANLLDPERHNVLVCQVWQENKKLHVYPDKMKLIQFECPRVSVLSAKSYEWVKVESGNPVPVNTVRVSDKNGSQHVYLGRIRGNRACGITEVDGMFDKFTASMNFDLIDGDTVTDSSGEVLLLTAEPMHP